MLLGPRYPAAQPNTAGTSTIAPQNSKSYAAVEKPGNDGAGSAANPKYRNAVTMMPNGLRRELPATNIVGID
jgi:hypothetical protein